MNPPADFRQHLEVETPEHVVLDYEIAGLGSRALATILDTLLLVLWLLAVLIVFSTQFNAGSWLGAVMTVVSFASIWGYFTFFEGLRHGQTPGKRRLGIRVVLDTGHPVSFGAAALRNLLRVADFLPPPYLLGALFVGLHPRGKRLGDLVAGTVVVRDRPAESLAAEPPPPTTADHEVAGVPELTDEEFRFLREYAERAGSLPPEIRARLAGRLTARLASRFPSREADPVRFLAAVYRDELARRRGQFGARIGEKGQEGGGGVAERLVARKSKRWEEFKVSTASPPRNSPISRRATARSPPTSRGRAPITRSRRCSPASSAWSRRGITRSTGISGGASTASGSSSSRNVRRAFSKPGVPFSSAS
jgi:uncharacterized RDD family membrane protein YckC